MSSKKVESKIEGVEKEVSSSLDQELRPVSWNEYVGQKAVKENLKILIQAATERGTSPEHILFYGPPGLGKTTLAHLIARETGKAIKITSGPAIERVGDLASILTNLAAGDILFIDEIHRMESGVLDIIIGKGPSARTIQLELPSFTLLAATTRVAMISSPLRSRFSGGVFRLEFYDEEELGEILKRSAKIIGVKIEDEAEKEIARRSRFTPRTANYLLKRIRDFAQVENRVLNHETVTLALKLLGVDEKGLSKSDIKILEIMADKFGGRPVGLGTLAAAISEEEATIEEFHEPYLIQLGLIERTPRGRMLTPHAYNHLGKIPPENLQKKLI